MISISDRFLRGGPILAQIASITYFRRSGSVVFPRTFGDEVEKSNTHNDSLQGGMEYRKEQQILRRTKPLDGTSGNLF